MKSPNHALNYNESTKIIAALRAMHTPNKPCVAGRGGVCLTHGNSIKECRDDDDTESS
jgi:hypothetical protein